MVSESRNSKNVSTSVATEESPLASLRAAYSEKRRDYFECSRPEVLKFFPKGAKRVLDVGCGAGSFGESVKVAQNCEVWGVEPDAESARVASSRLDRAFAGFFGEEIGLPEGYFNCVCFNDVLEHMVDPAAALKYAKKLLTKDGRILASIPNIRHFPTVWRLAVRGNWDYTERGILDKTHLRFFTANSIVRFFETEGFVIDQMEGINSFADMISGDTRLWKIYRLLSLWPTRALKEMRYLQFVVVARRNNAVL
jgi:2-polyprenyl-3-methyl-5-hydroxy-6-metoxy-1,4-benzoquinol methylase